MKKRAQKSLRKIKLLFLLLIMTIVLMITATYAWFSTQREVEVSGMRLNVEVAESMQISLDGEKWVQSIEIEDMRQFYGSYSDTSTHQANPITATDGNQNYVPTELLPVSTAGEVASGKLQFVQGNVTNGATTKLTGITACSEDDLTNTAEISTRQEGNKNHPYMVFDMYLRNISAKTTGQDDLKLNQFSKVYINTLSNDNTQQEGKGVADTGLEYSARVGMIVYGNTVSVTATDTTTTTEVDGEQVTTTTTVAEQIRGLSATGDEVAAIWEPNNLNHTTYVVSNNGRGITATSQAVTTYGIKSAIASAETKEIADINSTTDTNLVAVNTFKPTYTDVDVGTTVATVITDTAGNNVGLKPNQISKVRVYIWLEGQDPDCIDLASTGDKLNIDLKLTKDETNLTDQNTYTGEGTTDTGTKPGDILTASTVKTSDYGAYVSNYTASNGASVNWRIFHSDGSNIYLIADDYIENQYAPNGKGDIAVDTADTYNPTYTFHMESIVLNETNGYTGTTDWNTSIASKWLSKYTYTSTDYHAKATAYLLDTDKWAGFKDSTGYADYAVGGPTLELFTASYNATHETDIETQVAQSTKDTSYGYKIRWAGGEWTDEMIQGISVDDDLYVKNDATKAIGYWVAAPSASGASLVFAVGVYEGSGFVSSARYVDYGFGALPLVSLNSSVQIEMQEDGTFKIVE